MRVAQNRSDWRAMGKAYVVDCNNDDKRVMNLSLFFRPLRRLKTRGLCFKLLMILNFLGNSIEEK